jgi:hypothetical protein
MHHFLCSPYHIKGSRELVLPGVKKGQEFSLLQVFQTGSEVHPTSYPRVLGALSQEVKRLGREADHSPPTSSEVKKMWIYTSTSPYAFMA